MEIFFSGGVIMGIAKKVTATVLTSVMILSVFPATSVFAATNGWKKKSGEWYYYKNGTKLKSCWLTIYSKGKAKKYALDSKGRMCTSKNHKSGLKINGSMYFFTKSGGIQKKKWKSVKKGGKTYWFYLGSSGASVKGNKKIDKKYYYFDTYACWMASKELMDGQSFYPQFSFKSNGDVNTDVNGNPIITKIVFLGKKDVLKTSGWTKSKLGMGGDYFYFYLSGKGNPYKGWKKINSKWYYLDPNMFGARVEGTTKDIDGVYYIFDANGVCTNK